MVNITSTPTPFGTVHFTASGLGVDVSVAKKALRKAARGHGRALSTREHTFGQKVTVFAIYRKAV